MEEGTGGRWNPKDGRAARTRKWLGPRRRRDTWTARKVGMKEETGARWNEKLEGQEERQTEKIKQEGGRCGRSECVVRGRWG